MTVEIPTRRRESKTLPTERSPTWTAEELKQHVFETDPELENFVDFVQELIPNGQGKKFRNGAEIIYRLLKATRGESFSTISSDAINKFLREAQTTNKQNIFDEKRGIDFINNAIAGIGIADPQLLLISNFEDRELRLGGRMVVILDQIQQGIDSTTQSSMVLVPNQDFSIIV